MLPDVSTQSDIIDREMEARGVHRKGKAVGASEVFGADLGD